MIVNFSGEKVWEVIGLTGGKESGPWVGVSLGLSLLCPLGTQQCAGGTSEKSDSRRAGGIVSMDLTQL
jgi:hypothetical protein